MNSPHRADCRSNPQAALDQLKDGNTRFQAGEGSSAPLVEQAEATTGGQQPFAAILSCIDSRVPPEHIFDQGIGDLVCVRMAGNTVSPEVIASLEFACHVAGAKLLVVLGHTGCGAIEGTRSGVDFGHLSTITERIRRAVDGVEPDADSTPEEVSLEITRRNVVLSLEDLREQSSMLAGMIEGGEVQVQGALYHLDSREVEWLPYEQKTSR